MKIHFYFNKKSKEWHSSIHRGNGGISSMIYAVDGSFVKCLNIFSPKYIWRSLTWKNN